MPFSPPFFPSYCLRIPYISAPRNAPDAGKVVSGEVAYRHFVFRFDFKDWKVPGS